MSKKMLVDARHQEEIRVAVLSNGKVEDFDFESAARMPLRGNIYLARITRVEPSLQAAFVEYGGNRHGFLAFSEIHPDYYQIPVTDRDVLRQADALEVELAAKLAELDSESLVDSGADIDDDVANDDDSSDDGDDEETGSRRARSDSDEPRSGRGRDRRRGGRRRRRGRGDKEAQAERPEEQEASESEQPDLTASDDQAADTDIPAETAEIDETIAPDGAPDDAATTEAELSGETPDEDVVAEAASDETDGPQTIGLEDQPEPRLTQDLPDDEVVDDAISADEEPVADADPAPAEMADEAADAEDTSESEDAPTDVEEAPVDATADADADTEIAAEVAPEVEPEPKTEEQLEAERVAAEHAAEVADLRKRYDAARKEREKLLRNYRIQEVIKRRQILLVQVVKEERGNKGAALTTYMSLAGRYGVLMPNNARGGGVSRKITNASDRKRLRSAISELKVPNGQGLIIRTAGAKRTKAEIKRDYDYLARLWDTIREHTLGSIAPCLIYEEASLIKRAIRDLYDKDTGEIVVEGEAGYREAKDFMKMLMPSHAKNVQPYRDPMPLFLKHNVEQQLDEMYQPVVNLKSGGYLVIQQTEALISIDVNSGRATKERSVEATALKTNSEAAVEVARQCRLRDLAGLVVIDFIDMEENRNNRVVEKKLKEAMKVDRARIQIGSISGFGLMEMSRQRRRSGIVDGTTRACPTCDGAGAVRSVEMAALRILRSIEETAARDRPAEVTVETSLDVALYILNYKRGWLNSIESTHGVLVEVLSDHDKTGDQYDITKRGRATAPAAEDTDTAIAPTSVDPDDLDADSSVNETETSADGDEASGEEKPKKRRRRRRKSSDEGSSDDAEASEVTDTAEEKTGDASANSSESADGSAAEDEDGQPKKRRRRGRRGGRKAKTDGVSNDNGEPMEAEQTASEGEAESAVNGQDPDPAHPVEEVIAEAPSPEPEDIAAADEPAIEAPEVDTPEPVAASVAAAPPAKKLPKRGGWWQRALGRE